MSIDKYALYSKYFISMNIEIDICWWKWRSVLKDSV